MQHRILFVHGEQDVRELAARTLGRLGVSFDCAADVADARARLSDAEPYTVIVVALPDAAAVLSHARLRDDPKPCVIIDAPLDYEPAQIDPELVTQVVTSGDAATIIGVVLSCVAGDGSGMGDFLASRPVPLPNA